MTQVKVFYVTAGANQEIGPYIEKAVNPALSLMKDARVVSAAVDMIGSFHKATVIVSYEVPDSGVSPQAEVRKPGRPPKSTKEE